MPIVETTFYDVGRADLGGADFEIINLDPEPISDSHTTVQFSTETFG
jgi:hypothetical protein